MLMTRRRFCLCAGATIAAPRLWSAIPKKNLAGIEAVMGPLPAIDHHAPLQMRVLDEEHLEHYTRQHITYVPEPNSLVYAWLLIPSKPHGAAALCLHQTTSIGKDEVAGLGGKPNLHYGDELARRGYIVLAPDYPSFGEDKTDFKRDVFSRGYVSGTMKGIVNHMRGVDLLLNQPEVSPQRIAVIGHSLGGHNSLFVAAFDPRIQVVVTSCGFTAMNRYYGGDLKGWSQDRYMPRIGTVYHDSPAELPFDFPDILNAIAPRPVFINAPVNDSNFAMVGTDECVAKARKNFPDHRLVIVHPRCEHDFPPEVREQAYQFIDKHLGVRRPGA